VNDIIGHDPHPIFIGSLNSLAGCVPCLGWMPMMNRRFGLESRDDARYGEDADGQPGTGMNAVRSVRQSTAEEWADALPSPERNGHCCYRCYPSVWFRPLPHE
jgi:hypothetical protein